MGQNPFGVKRDAVGHLDQNLHLRTNENRSLFRKFYIPNLNGHIFRPEAVTLPLIFQSIILKR